MSILLEVFGSLLIIFMGLISFIVSLERKRYRKENLNCLKRSLFRYSIGPLKDNLVEIFLHNKSEMLMVNKGNDLCDGESDFKYYDYFKKLRREERNDQNN